MKILKIIASVVFTLSLVVYLSIPWGFMERSFFKTAWSQKSLFNYCKYEIPVGYKLSLYAEGAPGYSQERGIVMLENENTKQFILLTKARGFSELSLDHVYVGDKKIPNPIRHEIEEISPIFKVINYLPFWHFLRQDDISKAPDNLMLKGMAVDSKENYTTDTAKVLYLRGSFQRLGFFKEMPFPWGFVNPAYSFNEPLSGAVAILQNKNSKESIIIISGVPTNQTFDELVFKNFVSSVSFVKKVIIPPRLQNNKRQKLDTKYNFSR